jgi:hypothetical protein
MPRKTIAIKKAQRMLRICLFELLSKFHFMNVRKARKKKKSRAKYCGSSGRS